MLLGRAGTSHPTSTGLSPWFNINSAYQHLPCAEIGQLFFKLLQPGLHDLQLKALTMHLLPLLVQPLQMGITG